MEAPLAERIRPQKLDEYISQSHLVGPKDHWQIKLQRESFTYILGTTRNRQNNLAKIIAQESQRPFFILSANSGG
jgi:putative ATPase